MTCQINFWLVRSGPCLRLCAAIPPVNQSDANETKMQTATYASPGSFFSRLDKTIFEEAKVNTIKALVIHAIGTLDQVFTIPEIDLTPEQLGTLGIAPHDIN
jgi:hypothetical protein